MTLATTHVGYIVPFLETQIGRVLDELDESAPKLKASGVQPYPCGHNHDMQHLELEGQKRPLFSPLAAVRGLVYRRT